MNSISLRQVFLVDSPRIFEQCDALMDFLIDTEDALVYDAAVAADAERGVVEVEVSATGVTQYDAEMLALERVHRGLTEHVGVAVTELSDQRRVAELALA